MTAAVEVATNGELSTTVRKVAPAGSCQVLVKRDTLGRRGGGLGKEREREETTKFSIKPT